MKHRVRYAVNIMWDVNEEDVSYLIEDMDTSDLKELGETLGEVEPEWMALDEDARVHEILSCFRHCPAKVDEVFDLPSKIKIPSDLEDDEEISDWLSDEFGFCHNGFGIIEEEV